MIAARNQLLGTITEVKKGSLMAQVKFSIPAGWKMASVMTIDSLEDMGVKAGDRVEGIAKGRQRPAGEAIERGVRRWRA